MLISAWHIIWSGYAKLMHFIQQVTKIFLRQSFPLYGIFKYNETSVHTIQSIPLHVNYLNAWSSWDIKM